MVRFVKSTLKYFLFFILGIIVTALVAVTGISYYAVDQLSKATQEEPALAGKKKKKVVDENSDVPSVKAAAVNPNIKEVVKITLTYDQEFQVFDQLAQEVRQKSVPNICTTLCNPIHLDEERLKTERSTYLADYYKQEGGRALQDPLFLLKLEEIGYLSRLFPPSLRDILKQIDHLKLTPNDETQKWILATKTQAAVFRELSTFYSLQDKLVKDADRIKQLRGLLRKCQAGDNPKKIIAECQAQVYE